MSSNLIPEDDVLATRAAEGDRGALEALLEQSAPVAARVAYGILGREADALDAAQTALVTVVREIGRSWSRRNFRSWLAACAHHAAVDQLRHTKARRRHEELIAGNAVRQSDMPEQPLQTKEAIAALRMELALLPRDASLLVSLHHLEGLSLAQLSEHTGLTIDACKQRLSRARETLRERLERRGVAVLGLATLSTALDDWAAAAHHNACTQPPDTYRHLARAALLAAAGGVLGAAAGSQASTGISSSGTAAQTASAAGGVSPQLATLPTRIIKMIIAHPVSTGMLTAIIAALLGLAYAPDSRALERRSESKPVPGKEGGLLGDAESRANATRWQTPRFLRQGACAPDLIEAAAEHVALVAHAWGAANKEEDGYVLFLSTDAGQTFSRAVKLPFRPRALTLDEQGNCGLVSEPEASATDGGSFSWSLRSRAGQLSAPQAIWSFETGTCRAAVQAIGAKAGHWVCAEQGHMRMAKGINGPDAEVFTRDKILVAYGSANGCPRQVAALTSKDEAGLLLWGVDASSAGIVTTDDHWQTLAQHSTQDGGKTWTKTLIPLAVMPDSTSDLESVTPLLLKRDARALALVVSCQFVRKKGSEAVEDMFAQHYLLLSSDLGQTWQTPLPILKPQEFALNGETITGLHLFGESVQLTVLKTHEMIENGKWFAQTNAGQVPEPEGGAAQGIAGGAQAGCGGDSAFGGGTWTRYTTRLLASSDGGQSWFDQHAFEALGQKSQAPVLAGAGTTLHVAVFNEPNPIQLRLSAGGKTIEHEAEQYLVVRSFAGGEWSAPKTPPPASFKERKQPQPTREDF